MGMTENCGMTEDVFLFVRLINIEWPRVKDLRFQVDGNMAIIHCPEPQPESMSNQ